MRKMDLAGQTREAAAERFATQLFNSWGPGDAQCHNGAILLLSVEDRQARHHLEPLQSLLGFELRFAVRRCISDLGRGACQMSVLRMS